MEAGAIIVIVNTKPKEKIRRLIGLISNPSFFFLQFQLVLFYVFQDGFFLFGRRVNFQNPTVYFQGIIPEAFLNIDIPEMFSDDRVIGSQLIGLLQFNEGLIELFLFKINPSEAVQNIAVVGTEFKGPLNQVFRFIQMGPSFGIGITQVIQSHGVKRVFLYGCFQLLDAFPFLTHFIQENPQTEIEFGLIGIDLNAFQEQFFTLRKIIRLFIEGGQGQVDLNFFGGG